MKFLLNEIIEFLKKRFVFIILICIFLLLGFTYRKWLQNEETHNLIDILNIYFGENRKLYFTIPVFLIYIAINTNYIYSYMITLRYKCIKKWWLKIINISLNLSVLYTLTIYILVFLFWITSSNRYIDINIGIIYMMDIIYKISIFTLISIIFNVLKLLFKSSSLSLIIEICIIFLIQSLSLFKSVFSGNIDTFLDTIFLQYYLPINTNILTNIVTLILIGVFIKIGVYIINKIDIIGVYEDVK